MMDDPRAPRQESGAGLCDRCVHAKVIRSDRGSAFYLCQLSYRDARFARYPVIPVRACAGFVAADVNPDRDT